MALVEAFLHQADRFDAASDHHRHLVDNDPLRGGGDGLQARRAEPVDGRRRRRHRQAGADGRQAGDLDVVRALDNHRGPVLDLALRPVSETRLPMVLSVSEDATARFWQPTIGRMVRFASIPARPLQCEWLPGGRYAVVVSTDGHLRLIDPETVEVTWEVAAIAGWAYCLAVLPGGRLAVGGQAGELVVVEIPDRFLFDPAEENKP